MREYSFVRPLERWHRTARTWFDGSIESVDRRLADCRQLLAASRAAVGRDWGQEAASAHMARIDELQATERVLEAKREAVRAWDPTGPEAHEDWNRKHPPAESDGDVPAHSGEEWLHHHARGRHETLDVDFGENAPDHTNPYTGQSGRRSDLESDDTGFHWRHPQAARDRRYVELEAQRFVADNPGIDRDELVTRARHKASVETSTYTRERSAAVVDAFCSRVASLYRPPARRRTAAAIPDVADEMMFIV